MCYHTDPRSTEDLIRLAQESEAEVADGAYWEAMRILQHRLPHFIDQMRNLGFGTNEKCRELTATILGQNSVKDKAFLSECTDLLLGMLINESSSGVIISIAQALGHLHDPRAVDSLVPLRVHPDAGVRHAVAFGLLWYEEPAAIRAMVELSSDPDRDVRNWATFGLGQTDSDTPDLREALIHRLSEEDEEIRHEAIVGLARRSDVRVLPALKMDLDAGIGMPMDAVENIIRSANSTPDSVWLPVLLRLKPTDVVEADMLERSIYRCRQGKPKEE
jgi:hypothetical protein